MQPVKIAFSKPLVAMLLVFCARANAEADRLFTEKVFPMLESRCFSCHGPDKVKGGLRLDSREAALKGGDNGPAVVTGKPDESLLLQAVMHSKKDLEMPPKEKLTPQDILVLREWIAAGAQWPAQSVTVASTNVTTREILGDAWSDPRNPIVRLFGGQRLDLWSLKGIQRVDPPDDSAETDGLSLRRDSTLADLSGAKGGAAHHTNNSKEDSSVPSRHPIDRFIRSKLAEMQLAPAPEADRRTLARRVYFDLIGLPPSPEQMERFLNDRGADAFPRLVDELLASPRYGEHQARLWMDVIRYSDSNGFDWDEFRPVAWRFRDYLIRAFNADKPFDQLIREHLAGDEMFVAPPQNSTEQDYLIATGFLRLGPQDNSASLFNEQARARTEYLADLTETTASAFLGLTMSCNRCHDHKYDPLSQADHYRLRAFFEPVKYADDVPLDLAAEQEVIRTHNQAIDDQLKPLQERRNGMLEEVKKSLREEKLVQLTAEERAILQTPKEQRAGEVKETFERLEKKVAVSDKELTKALTDEQQKEKEGLTKQIDELKKQKRSFSLGLLATDNAETIPATRILFQGDHKAEREAVPPGYISILDPNPAVIEKPKNPKTSGRRLTLANWIASTNNPLTSRVMANRIWQQHFGRGLVATANDFGLAGERPTHPELLDWLANEFVRTGWSLKKMHRLIVTSATYRQQSSIRETKANSSVAAAPSALRKVSLNPDSPEIHGSTKAASPVAVDSENTLLWRQNPRRLSAEQLRDSILAVAGTLKLGHAGGPPIWPDLPPEILQANPAFLDDNETRTKGWYPSAKTNQHVRSVYLIQKRTVRVPLMETFDLPENSASCARRNESIVAPQALALLNNHENVEAARGLAARVEREAGSAVEAQIHRAFLLVTQRSPETEESRACAELLQRRSLAELCRALLNLNEFIYVD